MSRFSISVMVRPTLLVGSGALVVFAIFQMLAVPAEVAQLDVVAKNANLRLQQSEYVVQVFAAGTDVVLAESGGLAPGVISLAPGRYDVSVKVPGVWPQQLQLRRGVVLAGGQTVREVFDFAYGELEFRASVSGPDEPGEVVTVQVFEVPLSNVPVVGFEAGQTVKLAAGTYDVRSVRSHNSSEKQVRWLEAVEVSQGRRRQVGAVFDHGWVRVDASNGTEPITSSGATVTLFEAGDDSRKIVESGPVATPISMATGTWDLRVVYDGSSDTPTREVTAIEVVEGEVVRIPVAFSSGDIAVHASDANGKPFAKYDVYTYLYKRDDHRSPVAYGPAGGMLRASEGRYDVRANLFRSADQPDVWLRDVEITANTLSEYEVVFQSGDIIVRVLDQNGREQIGDEYLVTLYAPTDHNRALYRVQSGSPVRLAAGPVDLHIENTYTGVSQWRGATVVAGETAVIAISVDHGG